MKTSEESSTTWDEGEEIKMALPSQITKITFGCIMRPYGQAVKTSPFHGGNPSSNLGRVTKEPLIFSGSYHKEA